MERCANTEALNSYMRENEKQEACYNDFLNNIDDDLCELEDMIKKIKQVAKDYDGYDFSGEVKDLVNERI